MGLQFDKIDFSHFRHDLLSHSILDYIFDFVHTISSENYQNFLWITCFLLFNLKKGNKIGAWHLKNETLSV